MKKAGVAELKAKLSEYLKLVQGGAEIVISDREGLLPKGMLASALDSLDAVLMDMDVVVPTEPVRQRAYRAHSVHALRAADALQLAAALAWCEDKPAGERLVTLDERLRTAAKREGFLTVPL